MDDTQPSSETTQPSTPPIEGSSPKEVVPAEPPHFLPYIEEVAKKVPVVEFNQAFRITPNGLFVELSHTQRAVDLYKEWLVGRGVQDIKEDKLFKRLFGSDTPPRFYLAEGKKCLTGIFVDCPIKDPMRYRKAYYLGSPSPASDTIHPSDPLFTGNNDVHSIPGKGGIELGVSVGDKDVILPIEFVRTFTRLAPNSKKVMGRFPNINQSLSDAALALITIIRKAKLIKPEEEPLRPLRFAKDGDRIKCITRMGFYIYINQQHRVVGLYHAFGRNLYSWVREEVAFSLAREARGHVGSFEIFKRTHKFMGSLIIRGRTKMIHGKALTHFVKEALDAPALIKEPKGVKTIRTFVEPFINVLQLAEQIDIGKVSAFLSPRYRKGHVVASFEQWLIVQASRGKNPIIVDVFSRRAKNRLSESK